jgi:hypothetical protein
MAPQACAVLKASDLPATIAWYEAAGFAIRGSVPEPDPTWCEVSRDDLVLQFLAGETPWAGPPQLTGCFYVHPQDVRATYAEIKDRVECEWGVEEREWGTRELVVQDPNGYFITFSEPL